MAAGKKSKRSGSVILSRNRVLGPRKPEASLSAKAGRTLIRKHHTLQKQRAQALAKNDIQTAEKLQAAIDASGGLEKYQQASVSTHPCTMFLYSLGALWLIMCQVLGQSAQRGGDSSKILMDWINDIRGKDKPSHRLRVLEVGCLSSDNAIAKSPLFDVTL